ncbi:hypothetical protein BRADI_4g32787v3 [Brachypodium distachyon]|uniref:Uncharacterized protein n=1 Tax=Brachypodium distachyon TaxID=15368 RepID=A0A2K2CRX1_BRADI|nr:hypothetical protein BRADI_4g32787v3 [Brachypodium distachyon]
MSNQPPRLSGNENQPPRAQPSSSPQAQHPTRSTLTIQDATQRAEISNDDGLRLDVGFTNRSRAALEDVTNIYTQPSNSTRGSSNITEFGSFSTDIKGKKIRLEGSETRHAEISKTRGEGGHQCP